MKGLLAGAGKVEAGVEFGGEVPGGFKRKGLFAGGAVGAEFEAGGEDPAGLIRNGLEAALALATGLRNGFELI
jgi:hypothetical protein